MVIKCPKCHSDNPDTQKYCGECATPLPSVKDIEITKTLETQKEELSPGSTFAGRYQIIEELGKGGMGRVYKVLDLETNERIALKLIKLEIASDKKTIERFRNELTTTRKIVQKNVCRMYDLNKEKSHYYITMEYISGQDLKGLIRQTGQLTVGKAVSIAKQVCEGLAEAHSLGVVHRDLKPNNIMIDRDGNAKIMDFGIAKAVKGKSLTGSGVMIGTPQYMSPEQAQGKEVDHQTDIWSFGIVLYEMVTGQLPFKGEYEQAVVYSILNEDPEPVTDIRSEVPKELQKIIYKTLAKEPSERYKNVDELMEDFKKINTDPIPEKYKALKGKTKQTQKAISFGIILIAAVIIAGYFIFKEKKEEPVSQIISKTEKTTETKWKNSIAVLPFEDMSPQKDQEYFCDGIADEIINALTHISELRVVARTSAFSFKGKNMDIREIGKKLNVGAILEGSVRKSGDNLRVTAQLINVESGYHLWSEKYERKLADIFTVQDEISLAIVEKLEIKVLGKEKIRLTKRHTENIQAYNLYLKVRYFWNKRTKSDLEKAIEYFNESLEIDSDYALAYSGMADCYTILAAYGFAPARPNFKKAKEMVTKALAIDDLIAEAHASLGWVILLADWAWENAEREFIRAIELNPGYATAHHWYTYSFLLTARFNEALKRIYHAQELDPLSPIISRVVAEVLFYNQEYDKSIKAAQASLEMVPGMPYAHSQIGINYIRKGLYQKALIEFEKEKVLWSNQDGIDTSIGITYAKMGKRKDAEQIKERLKSDDKNCYRIAQLCFSLGENEEGFEWLEKAYQEKIWWLGYAKINLSFENVRADPRFQALLKKMGLEK